MKFQAFISYVSDTTLKHAGQKKSKTIGFESSSVSCLRLGQSGGNRATACELQSSLGADFLALACAEREDAILRVGDARFGVHRSFFVIRQQAGNLEVFWGLRARSERGMTGVGAPVFLS